MTTNQNTAASRRDLAEDKIDAIKYHRIGVERAARTGRRDGAGGDRLRAEQAALHLLVGDLVGVVPEGAGVWRDPAVGVVVARLDGVLRDRAEQHLAVAQALAERVRLLDPLLDGGRQLTGAQAQRGGRNDPAPAGVMASAFAKLQGLKR